jgi:hypothetical protein
MSNDFPGYVYLGSGRWVRREHISPSLIAEYDRTFHAAENNPGVIDSETGRAFGALWLDAVDQISDHVTPLRDQDLRNRAEHRKLDAMLPRSATRP